jgi:hypothetical protein
MLQSLPAPLSRNFCDAAQGQETGGLPARVPVTAAPGHGSGCWRRSGIDEIRRTFVDIGAHGFLLVGAADQLLLFDGFRQQRDRRIN